MNTTELINYYADLLAIQYLGKPKAYATIQTLATPTIMPQVSVQEIAFSSDPNSGAVTLFYDTTPIVINWNDSTATIQAAFQAVTGLSAVTVTGLIANQLLIVTYTGVTPPAFILTVGANTLGSLSGPVEVTVTETDVTLPIAVQNAFNVTGPNPAEGVQLDVIGKYAGVSRTSQGFTSQITLNDTDFMTLIKIAIIQNNAGSSTYEIVTLLNQFFPGQIFLFDRQTMEFDYYISTSVGSTELLQVFIVEGLLPRPMAVRIRLIIYAPIINTFFGFRTYGAPANDVSPFNSYADYQLDWPWLSYAYAIII